MMGGGCYTCTPQVQAHPGRCPREVGGVCVGRWGQTLPSPQPHPRVPPDCPPTAQKRGALRGRGEGHTGTMPGPLQVGSRFPKAGSEGEGRWRTGSKGLGPRPHRTEWEAPGPESSGPSTATRHYRQVPRAQLSDAAGCRSQSLPRPGDGTKPGPAGPHPGLGPSPGLLARPRRSWALAPPPCLAPERGSHQPPRAPQPRTQGAGEGLGAGPEPGGLLAGKRSRLHDPHSPRRLLGTTSSVWHPRAPKVPPPQLPPRWGARPLRGW